jgi:hypothetical protein
MTRDKVRGMLMKHRRWGEGVSIWGCIRRGAPVAWQLEFLIDDLMEELQATTAPPKAAAKATGAAPATAKKKATASKKTAGRFTY